MKFMYIPVFSLLSPTLAQGWASRPTRSFPALGFYDSIVVQMNPTKATVATIIRITGIH